jgi:phosphatidylserine/phosphatidylglycerophosphate/cardiolipin synthase-like enzyme
MRCFLRWGAPAVATLAVALLLVVGCGGNETTGPDANGGGAATGGGGTASGGGGAVSTGGTGGGGSSAGASLVINEILYDPAKSSDEQGEWVELFNPGDEPVDIAGWALRDQGTNSHLVTGSVIVPAGGFAVLARSGDAKVNGGVAADYVYGDDFKLANDGDAVVLQDPNGAVVDSVSYGVTAPWPLATAGVSIELSTPSADNTKGASWQLAVLPFGAGDLGTPGKPNGGTPGTFTIDTEIPDWHEPTLKASLRFAPLDDLEGEVMARLAAATKQIRLAFFNIRLDAVRDLLAQKVKQNVDVHVVLDKKTQDLEYNTMDEELVKAGVPVTLVENTSATEATMHDKFTVVDGSLVMTGSANYSQTALHVSDEDLITFEDPALAARYLDEFDELVAGGADPSPPYTGQSLQAWMGPEDDLGDRVVAALDAAKSTALVAMFEINTKAIIDALLAAKGRGVVVVVVLDKKQAAEPTATGDETLAAAGIPVVLALNTGNEVAEMHSKLLIVDHQVLLMGSYNWTNLGTYYNDENLVIVNNAHLAARAEGKLAELFQTYSAPPAASLGLTTGKQAVSLTVTNVTLSGDVKLRVKGTKGGPFDPPVELVDGTLATTIDCGTRLEYRYEIVKNSAVLASETLPHSFTLPYAPGPFVIVDAYR